MDRLIGGAPRRLRAARQKKGESLVAQPPGSHAGAYGRHCSTRRLGSAHFAVTLASGRLRRRSVLQY